LFELWRCGPWNLLGDLPLYTNEFVAENMWNLLGYLALYMNKLYHSSLPWNLMPYRLHTNLLFHAIKKPEFPIRLWNIVEVCSKLYRPQIAPTKRVPPASYIYVYNMYLYIIFLSFNFQKVLKTRGLAKFYTSRKYVALQYHTLLWRI